MATHHNWLTKGQQERENEGKKEIKTNEWKKEKRKKENDIYKPPKDIVNSRRNHFDSHKFFSCIPRVNVNSNLSFGWNIKLKKRKEKHCRYPSIGHRSKGNRGCWTSIKSFMLTLKTCHEIMSKSCFHLCYLVSL